MAREVFIHNSRIIKKCLSFTDVIGDENYAVSYLDEYMRFTTQESESCFTMLFNNDSIGRGIQIVETDKYSFHLAVNLPAPFMNDTALWDSMKSTVVGPKLAA